MNRTVLPFIFYFVLVLSTDAQFVDKSLNIYFSAGAPISPLNKLQSENGFKSPSFFANFNKASSFSIGINKKHWNNWNIGIEYSAINLEDWNFNDSELFIGSTAKVNFIGPTLEYYQSFNNTLRSISYGIKIKPAIVLVDRLINLEYLTTSNLDESVTYNSPMTTISLTSSPYLKLSLNQLIDFHYNVNVNITPVSSPFYNDTVAVYIINEIGFTLKFIKDKRYYLHQ